VVEFPISHAGQEDKALKKRMRQPANLRGVLAWAVRGAREWYARGDRGLQTPERVRDATDRHRQENDHVRQWLEECVELTGSPDDFVPNVDLYANYKEWSEANGVKPLGKSGMTRELKKKRLDAGKAKWNPDEKKAVRGCVGIRLMDQE
jgi:phage/plasmid-associated DNA primase